MQSFHSTDQDTRQPYERRARRTPFFRPAEWVLATLLGLVALTMGTTLLYRANSATLVSIPKDGGVHVEGILGSPRFINPLLAVSDADNDLTTLVYAGLLTLAPDGSLVPELAESYTISDDGRTYHFVLKDDLTFQDGTPLTTADVAFTVERAKDVLLKSPKFLNWDGVDVVVHNEKEIDFVLPEPYAPFIENTTLGILPMHIWGQLATDEFPFSEFNNTAVGSGPYQIENVVRDAGGIPTRYELRSFDRYALGAPHLSKLVFNLYRNNEELIAAYDKGAVDAMHSIPHEQLENLAGANDTKLYRAPYLRVFALFLNHNRQPLFLRDEVATALAMAVPKQAIVSKVLGGYGTILNGPFPPGMLPADTDTPHENTVDGSESTLAEAQALLESAGWERGEDGVYVRTTEKETLRLALALVTANTPELVGATETVAESWRKLGVDVDLKVFDPSDLTQSVIRPRRYDALLFGIVVGREMDMYAFWHSSQRNDPGLNIAQYADIEADSLLTNARAATSSAERTELYARFDTLVRKAHTAVFLYSPDFLYVTRDAIQGIQFRNVTTPADRFAGVHEWYKDTDHVWPFIEDLL